MDMIKKIAITASTMLFVLAQIFSFYMIYTGQKEKIELIRQYERQIMENGSKGFRKEMDKLTYQDSFQENVVTYCFRKEMPQNSALYLDGKELYNNSAYTFQVEKLSFDQEHMSMEAQNGTLEKLNGKYLVLYYEKYELGENSYIFCHVLDITYIYKKSYELILREILISVLISAGMAVILVILIKKITKPLEAINEAQRQLIGSMSHELKTPLTAIKGYSETLLNVKLSGEQTEKSLQYINTETGRLSRLSEKMMELTRLYEPECNIEQKPLNIEELFKDVEYNVTYKLKEKNMTLLYEGNYQGLIKNMDKDLMTSFLINLINNSIMASQPGSHIFLGADENAVWVRDEGCGIPAKEVDKVCRAFYRVDKSRARKNGNMGLGLALCEQIAKVHHADMKIESKIGKGTKILLMLK